MHFGAVGCVGGRVLGSTCAGPVAGRDHVRLALEGHGRAVVLAVDAGIKVGLGAGAGALVLALAEADKGDAGDNEEEDECAGGNTDNYGDR